MKVFTFRVYKVVLRSGAVIEGHATAATLRDGVWVFDPLGDGPGVDTLGEYPAADVIGTPSFTVQHCSERQFLMMTNDPIWTTLVDENAFVVSRPIAHAEAARDEARALRDEARALRDEAAAHAAEARKVREEIHAKIGVPSPPGGGAR